MTDSWGLYMLPQGNNEKIEGKVKSVFFGKVLYKQLR